MFSEKFKELESLKEKLEKVNLEIDKTPDYAYSYGHRELLRELLKIGSSASHLSDFEFELLVSKVEMAETCLSKRVLKICVSYLWVLIRRTEDYLQLQVADYYLGAECSRQQKQLVA